MTKIGETRLGSISHRTEVYKICPDCKQGFWSRADKEYPCCKSCWAKEGRIALLGGYNYIKISETDLYYTMCPTTALPGNGWLRLSRYTMAKHLGRCLEEDEQVYHKNLDSLDDNLNNLRVHKIVERSEEDTRKTRAYKFGYKEGYDVGYEEGYGEGQTSKQEEEVNWFLKARERKNKT
uniref:Uncharacterized protein n=1 Tax=viral metagenome TaxID=1070528 RepID=A0A6H2A5E5_9ZZZZ